MQRNDINEMNDMRWNEMKNKTAGNERKGNETQCAAMQDMNEWKKRQGKEHADGNRCGATWNHNELKANEMGRKLYKLIWNDNEKERK